MPQAIDPWARDTDVVSHALNLWANWIETEDVTMSGEDAVSAGMKDKVNVLSTEQMRFVVRLRDLAQKVRE